MRDPFFVVTTGRSGSLSLALTLDQHPYIVALHEPWLHLIERAQAKATKRLTGSLQAEVELFSFLIPRPPGPQLCGIVDQKLTQFISGLATAFPEGRFVWLVRDGRDVVASAYVRGWYTEQEREYPSHAWARYRIHSDDVGEYEPEGWTALGSFGRCCWYWAWTQREIRRQLADLDSQCWRMFQLEELVDRLDELQEFLQVRPEALHLYHANAGPRQQVQALRWQTWSEDQQVLFDRICGEEMDWIYPGWREQNSD